MAKTFTKTFTGGDYLLKKLCYDQMKLIISNDNRELVKRAVQPETEKLKRKLHSDMKSAKVTQRVPNAQEVNLISSVPTKVPLYIDRTSWPKLGRMVVALEEIPEGTLICEYSGTICIRPAQEGKKELEDVLLCKIEEGGSKSKKKKTKKKKDEEKDTWVIDPSRQCNIGRFLPGANDDMRFHDALILEGE